MALAIETKPVPGFAQAQPADSAAPSDQQIQEVVVTAERRKENLQDVPISVAVVSGAVAENQGVLQTSDLTIAVPGLEFSKITGAGIPFIRGVGTPNSAVGNEASVPVYIDGVYISTEDGNDLALKNVEQIEVLKGPQGTLFGRNATGGVIQVTTRDPTSTPSGDLEIGYGNYNTSSASFYGTTGITDKIATDLAVSFNNQDDGWGTDVTTGQDAFKESDLTLRTKTLFKLDDDTEVRLALDYSQTRGEEGVGFHFIPPARGVDGVTQDIGFYNTADSPNDSVDIRQGGASVKVNHDFGWSNFVSISAYRQNGGFVHLDQDATPLRVVDAPISSSIRTESQELQLLSPDESKLKWIVGLYYLHDSSAYTPLELSGFASAPFPYIDIYADQVTDSYSGFGQATAEILPNTHLTGGLRYTLDNRSIDGSTDTTIGALESGSQSVKFEKLTWHFALDHQFTPDLLGYVSNSRGFKSGVFNIISYTAPAVRPEVLDDYEIGIKSEWFDHQLKLNLDGFYYQYSNIQVQQVVTGTVNLVNAASATIKGLEADFTITPASHLTVNGGFALLDGHYDDFENAPFSVPLAAGGDAILAHNESGFDTVRTPHFSGNAAVSYTYPTDTGAYSANLLYSYNSGFDWDPDNRLRQRSYSIVNTTVGWEAPSGTWGAKLWARNLLNQEYLAYSSGTSLGDIGSPAPPRTFGITLDAHF